MNEGTLQMSLSAEEQILVNEAMKLVIDGLAQLAASSDNPKVAVVAHILEGGIRVAEMMLGA